jgi:hypothetical protein
MHWVSLSLLLLAFISDGIRVVTIECDFEWNIYIFGKLFWHFTSNAYELWYHVTSYTSREWMTTLSIGEYRIHICICVRFTFLLPSVHTIITNVKYQWFSFCFTHLFCISFDMHWKYSTLVEIYIELYVTFYATIDVSVLNIKENIYSIQTFVVMENLLAFSSNFVSLMSFS